MTLQEMYKEFPFIEKEDLQVWPENMIEQIDAANAHAIMDYLEKGPVSGAELLVLDLPAFLYPVKQFTVLWEALAKEQGRAFADNVLEEEITPSDEFPRLEKKVAGKKK